MELADLELVNEYNNCYFISLINVLNGIVSGEKINKYELNERISKEVDDNNDYFSGEIVDEVFRECTVLFDIADDKTFKRRSSASIPVCLSEAERIYIKAILSSKYGKLFLSEKETAELINSLGYVPDIPLNDYLISVPSKKFEYTDDFISKFRILLTAIKERKEISHPITPYHGISQVSHISHKNVKNTEDSFTKDFSVILYSVDLNLFLTINLLPLFSL